MLINAPKEMNLPEHRTAELLKMYVTPLELRTTDKNTKYDPLAKGEKKCIVCKETKERDCFPHVERSDGTIRLDKRKQVCNTCLETEEGQDADIYRLKRRAVYRTKRLKAEAI